VTQLAVDECSLFPYTHYWLSSKRILTSQGFISGSGFFLSIFIFSSSQIGHKIINILKRFLIPSNFTHISLSESILGTKLRAYGPYR
jgi:hypothetical protein